MGHSACLNTHVFESPESLAHFDAPGISAKHLYSSQLRPARSETGPVPRFSVPSAANRTPPGPFSR